MTSQQRDHEDMDSAVLSEVVELLYGGGGSDIIAKMESGVAKMNPTQSDLAAKDRRKRSITAGLSAVGAGAGGLGLAAAGNEVRRNTKKAGSLVRGFKSTPKLTRALLPVEVAGLGGELMATKILHGDAKKRGTLVKKYSKAFGVGKAPTQDKNKRVDAALDMLNRGIPSGPMVARTVAANPQVRRKTKKLASKGTGKLKRVVTPPDEVGKRDEIDVLWTGEFAKADSDKQQIFGWASVVEVNGEPVVDLQGDYISVDEMEKAAYTYVTKSRKGGDMHLRDDWNPIQKSEMIESFVITEDKRDAMGLPDSIPTGWWVGFKVSDPDVWSKIKSGERTGFSIHGRGQRTPR